MNRIRHRLIEEKFLWRFLIYVLGLFIAAFGVAFATNAALGLSPMNSFPYVLSLITGIDMGLCVAFLLSFYVLLQIFILGRNFRWIQLSQLLCAFLFGYFVDFTRLLLGDFVLPTYFGQLAFLLISMICIATGITLFMSVRLVPLPSEALVAAITQRLSNAKFHIVMIVVHTTVVTIGLLLSFLFLGGLFGVREGTILSAVMIGKMIPFIQKAVSPMLTKLGIIPME